MTKLGSIVGKPVFEIPKPASLALPYGKVGIEIEVENCNPHVDNDLGGVWVGKQDGSLKNEGREFVTNGGIVGTQIISAIDGFCKVAEKHKLSVGYPRAGIHIHVDCTDLSMDEDSNQLAIMTAFYLLIEHAVFSYAGDWRQWCGFCDPINASNRNIKIVKSLLRKDVNYEEFSDSLHRFDRYTGYNLQSLSKYGTVEYRHLPTTFDSKRITEWINLLLQIKKVALEWDFTKDFLAEVSLKTPREFAREKLGSYWNILAAHFDEGRAWGAVDDCVYVLARETGRQSSWDVSESPLLGKKKRLVKSVKKEKEKTTEAIARENREVAMDGLVAGRDVLPPQPIAPQRQNRVLIYQL